MYYIGDTRITKMAPLMYCHWIRCHSTLVPS